MNTHNSPDGRRARKEKSILSVCWYSELKFFAHIMVSTGVCFNGTGRLHYVADKAKINANYYVRELLPKLVDDCEFLMPDGSTFQQDGAPAHTSGHAQDWFGAEHA